jgi:hypothetical protein
MNMEIVNLLPDRFLLFIVRVYATRHTMIPSQLAADTATPIPLQAAFQRAGRWRTRLMGLARATASPGALLLLVGAFFALYTATLTSFHSFDSVAYALNIRRFEETGRSGWLLHPHHLLFNSLAWISHEMLIRFIDPNATTLTALQMVTCTFGALGIGLFAVWIYEVTRSYWTSGIAALALGGSWGWWFASTDGRATVAATALLPVVLWAMSRAARAPNPLGLAPLWYAALAGGTLAFICLLHESHVLFLPVAVGAALLPKALLKARLRRAAACIAAFTVTVATPYALVLLVVKRVESLSEAQAWLLSYARQNTWWSFALPDNFFHDARAVWKLLSGQDLTAHGGSITIGDTNSLVSLLLWTILVSVSIYGWGRRADLNTTPAKESEKFTIPVTLAGLAVYTAFFTFWDPGYYVFWFVPVLCLITLLAIGWQYAASAGNVRVLLLFVVLTLAATNYSAAILPRQDTAQNPHLGLAEAVSTVAHRRGIVVATGAGRAAEAEVYVPYFARMQVLALHQALAEANGDRDRGFASVQNTIRKVLERGDPVFLLSEVITPGEGQRALTQRYSITPDQLEALLSPYQRRRVGSYQDLIIYQLARTPLDAGQATQAEVAVVPHDTQNRSLLSSGDLHRTHRSVLPADVPQAGQKRTTRPVRQSAPQLRQLRPSRPPVKDSVPPSARPTPPTIVQRGPGPR